MEIVLTNQELFQMFNYSNLRHKKNIVLKVEPNCIGNKYFITTQQEYIVHMKDLDKHLLWQDVTDYKAW